MAALCAQARPRCFDCSRASRAATKRNQNDDDGERVWSREEVEASPQKMS
jgi:hypothetical protein